MNQNFSQLFAEPLSALIEGGRKALGENEPIEAYLLGALNSDVVQKVALNYMLTIHTMKELGAMKRSASNAS